MTHTSKRLLTALALSLTACRASRDAREADEPRSWNGDVRIHGALRAMMHEGQTGPTVRLDSLLPNPRLYAVGALADLAGEVTVVGGQAYLAVPEGAGAARTDTSLRPTASATLLVATEVPDWVSVTTDRAIRFDDLDERIASLAAAAGWTPKDRFPFLLEGTFEKLRWHVIDGRRLAAGGSHQDHQSAAVQAGRERARATLVGFYSDHDQGVFTHMGSRTHIHCVVHEPVASGHVDHIEIPAGITLRFPRSATASIDKATQPGPTSR
jgi:acetolactate decarboxylase